MMKRSKITSFSLASAVILCTFGLPAIAKENVGVTGNSNKNSAVSYTHLTLPTSDLV